MLRSTSGRNPGANVSAISSSRLAIALDEAGAENLVAAHHLGEGGGERRRRERPGEAVGGGYVVGRAPRRQAVEEPEPLLRVGERRGGVRGAGIRKSARHERRQGRPGRPVTGIAGGQSPSHRLGEAGDRRCIEDLLHRQVGPEHCAEARQQADGEERVAAQEEEVVVDADRMARMPQRVQAEEILPDPGDHLLDGIAGRRPRRGVRLAGRPRLADRLGRRQRPPVDLAVGVERQLREGHEERRHHVLRQALAEVDAELGRCRRGRPVRAPPSTPSGT